ncbi:hypothetical protein SCHPADRAFT_941120 [Schizopora paradoxa]|uniref:Uncharacterized protein n=1 Tax=Schizopora paradoxa TaxID=27342 RepID=A0A0H2RLU0_9AGAM|nr:hypothetical protein SCHPADRAFT_941120 [Schizopora paradoxa]
MPSLQQNSVSVKLDDRNVVDQAALQRNGYYTNFFSSIIEVSLPDPLVHTHLTSLSLALTWELPPGMQRTWMQPSISSMKVFIPLDRIPFVTELSLSMYFHPTFIGNKSERPSGHGYHPKNRSCALRKLCLRDCAYVVIWQLQEMVQSLKELGAWDALERFIVEDRTSVAPDRALEAVGSERLTFIGTST